MLKTSIHTRQPVTNRLRILLLLLSVAALAPSSAFALGFRIPNQDAEAIARGNAFVATADNPSAIYYNPAGITQLPGHTVQIGILNYLGINTHYEAQGGGESDTRFEVIPVPQIHYTFSPAECPVSFGLGIFAPFGLGVKWPEDSGFRSIAIDSKLQFMTVNPVIAWKPHPTLSLAAGPAINYSEINFTRGLLSGSDFYRFKGDDFSFGFNVGILWQPHEQWSFGANYRSASTMNYEGDSTYNPGGGSVSAPTSARVHFPQIISGGVSYRPSPKWNVEVNVDWTDWETMNTIVLQGSSAIFGIDLPLTLNWHSSWFYEVGVTRYLEDGWFVSAGYFFSSDTASSTHFTPAIPDTDLHVGSLGVGRRGERWHWAVAAQLITGPARSITDSQPNPFTGESANGDYQLFVPTISFALGYRF